MRNIGHEGVIRFPSSALSRSDLNYFYQVIKNAKVDQVLIYQIDDTVYIIGDSMMTYLVGIMKIQLSQEERFTIEVSSSTPTEDTNTDSVDSFDDDFSDLGDIDLDIDEINKEIKNTTTTKLTSNTVLAFCTEVTILEALMIDEDSPEVKVLVSKDEIIVESENFQVPYPIVRFVDNFDYYLSMTSDKNWERVNHVAVNDIAKATASMTAKSIDTFIVLEKDDIYSDNISILMSAKSWQLKDRYYFGYQTITAFNKIPSNVKEVYIAKTGDVLLLRVNDIYLAWAQCEEKESVNIMNYFNLEKMDGIITVTQKEFRKWKSFDGVLPVKDDHIVTIDCLEDNKLTIRQDNRMLTSYCTCKAGVHIVANLTALLKAMNVCGKQDYILKTNLVNTKLANIFIQGQINVLISVEKVSVT